MFPSIHAVKQLRSYRGLLSHAKKAYNDNDIMQELIFLITIAMLVMILAKLPVSVVSDTSTLSTDSSIPDNELKEK